MHKHLEKQLNKFTTDGVVDCPALLRAVSDYYTAIDRERSLRDRSLGLMSEELLALNQRIQAQGEARFRSVFDQAADALLVADTEDRISRCNQAAAILLGCTQQALVGEPMGRFLRGPSDEGEREVWRVDGVAVPVEVRRQRLQLGDDADLLYNLRDISERQQVERERAAFIERLARSNAELERFAYIASHDLQEPLRTIISFTGLLQRRLEPVLDEVTRDYLNFVLDGSTRMRDMIGGLLELSRLDGAPPQAVSTPLVALMEEVQKELGAAIESAGARLRYEALPVVFADPRLVKRVLLNLVGNALKFRGDAEPQIDVTTQPSSTEWCISVRDNGLGIAPEHRQHVFQLFRRLHTTDQFPGTGMGLAICERIVTAHGGRIWVEPNQGIGSIFRFTLPR